MFKWQKVIAQVLVVFTLFWFCGSSILAIPPEDKEKDFYPEQILVKFQPDIPAVVKNEIHKKNGGKVINEIDKLGVEIVKVPYGQVVSAVKSYKAEKEVLYAEPDYLAEAQLIPNDPRYGEQWGLPKIEAPEAWDLTTGSNAIRIAILDTGIDQDHEDLAAKIVANRNFTTSKTVDDLYGHGTHVAGIAAAVSNNAKGVAGASWLSTLMNGKVLGDSGSGQYSWIASGIIWAADNEAKVINMSLGGSSASTTLQNAVDYAWGKGVVLVAAAGNSNTSSPLYPAYYTNCIAVAATDSNDAKASFSSFGDWVDIAAPGVSILSTLPNHRNKIKTKDYGSLSGTSMASPFVAGVAGLVWAAYPGITNSEVRSKLEKGAVQVGTMWSSYEIKRLNAFNAVR